jgi:hypothetical protein
VSPSDTVDEDDIVDALSSNEPAPLFFRFARGIFIRYLVVIIECYQTLGRGAPASTVAHKNCTAKGVDDTSAAKLTRECFPFPITKKGKLVQKLAFVRVVFSRLKVKRRDSQFNLQVTCDRINTTQNEQ